MSYKKLDFNSNYFDLFELKKGIYAAIAKENSGSSVNAGFFDLGNYLIIFDTFIYPGAARDMYDAAKKFTGKEPTFVINSHYHNDHIFGNVLFPEKIPILSSHITLKKIKEVAFNRLEEYRKNSSNDIKKVKEMLQTGSDEAAPLELNNDLEFFEYITNPQFKIRLPDILINNDMIINGTEKVFHLIYEGIGHTDSDIVAFFPNEKLCFMGDLLFANLEDDWAPSKTGQFNAVNPPKLYENLNSLLEKDIKTYIPGHGALSSKDDVQRNMDFIEKYYLKC